MKLNSSIFTEIAKTDGSGESRVGALGRKKAPQGRGVREKRQNI